MGRSAAYTIAVSIDKQPEVIYNSVDELSKELNIKKSQEIVIRQPLTKKKKRRVLS
jgi:hypothetical protein